MTYMNGLWPILGTMMNKVVDKYYRENYESLVKRTKNAAGSIENSEDIVQEAFSRALKYFDSCSIDFDRWFKVILSRVLKDHQRDSRLAGLTKNIDDTIDELEPIIPDHIKDFFRDHMNKLSLTKPSYNKEIIRLNILFGYDPKEISESLDVSIKIVKNNLYLFSKEVKEIYG